MVPREPTNHKLPEEQLSVTEEKQAPSWRASWHCCGEKPPMAVTPEHLSTLLSSKLAAGGACFGRTAERTTSLVDLAAARSAPILTAAQQNGAH